MAVHQALPLFAEVGLVCEPIVQPEQIDYYAIYMGVG